MDFDSNTIEKSPDVCRFCSSPLSGDIYRENSVKPLSFDRIEAYEHLLKETFNIQLSNQANASTNICTACITSLNQAHCFKLLVVASETKLAQIKDKLEEKECLTNQLKVAAFTGSTKERCGDLSEDFNDEDSLNEDETLANLELEEAKQIDPTGNTKHSDTRNKRTKFHKSGQKSKTEKDWLKLYERRGNGPILRENSLKLIANSTLCVFQWNKSRYRCFCCNEPHSDINLLKAHTKNHTIEEIEKRIITQQNRLVKCEVSNLFCKLCNSETTDLATLRCHLTENHGVQFRSPDGLLVPFKINNDLRCQICEQPFSLFRLLNIHVNAHFKKEICHICGACFSNLVFLNLHKSRCHKPLECKQCGLAFLDRAEKRRHDAIKHGAVVQRKLRFPCPYCPERFFQENRRVLHLVDKHNMDKPNHRCEVCAKTFVTRSLRNNHVKTVHMKERKHGCDVCNNFFYTKSDVNRHKVTHSREKKFSCDICSSLFATKDSLRRHTKRRHC